MFLAVVLNDFVHKGVHVQIIMEIYCMHKKHKEYPVWVEYREVYLAMLG